MKLADVVDRGPQIRDRDVHGFESLVGCTLPGDYRDFLLATNGGEPHAGDGWFHIGSGNKQRWSRVRFFYGLKRADTEHWLLAASWTCFRTEIPDHSIPIACDVYGNQIVLEVVGRRKGRVGFWSHESDEPIRELAKSFTEFLRILQTEPL